MQGGIKPTPVFSFCLKGVRGEIVIKFIIIAGMWVNTAAITTLTPETHKKTKREYCTVTIAHSWFTTSGVNSVTDQRPCAEIIKLIEEKK